jgi:hypothetical protein
MQTKLRLYEPIWLSLKKHKTCTILVPTHLHARVIKAVIKEKWLDNTFKKREGWRQQYLSYHISGNEITFKLSYRVTELIAKDL